MTKIEIIRHLQACVRREEDAFIALEEKRGSMDKTQVAADFNARITALGEAIELIKEIA